MNNQQGEWRLASIDVTKVEKEHLQPDKQTGKPRWLNLMIYWPGEVDKFGQEARITQSVSKEKREAGVRGPIIGNVYAPKDGVKTKPKKAEQTHFDEAAKAFTKTTPEDDVPF